MAQPEPFGKFLLLGLVAQGGMAEIYKGRYKDPTAPQNDIAVKRILPSYTEDQGFVTMFKDEGNIALRLRHPNIVGVYEVDEVNNDWYIAMEFVHGTDLRVLSDACEQNRKRFTSTQIARIICDTAKALDYAHKATYENGECMNIVHRDCTPHNIMISYDGQVKLMDFGIAKAASRATKTRAGTVKGKSSYMSPEQARGRNLDGRSDMFTLGTVGWEMLTAHRLFKGGNDMEAIGKILKSTTPHPSDLDSNIPRELGDIILKTLEKDREQRYPTCGELASALENYIATRGDGSDKQLGLFVQAILSKNGHSPAEIPDYVPGASMFEIDESGNFKLKNNAPAAAPAPMRIDDNKYPQQPSQPQMVQPSMAPYATQGNMNPGYGGAPAGESAIPPKKPVGLIITSIILLLLGVGMIVGGLALKSSGSTTEAKPFELPEARLTLKSDPSGAFVYVNGEKLADRTPAFYNSKPGEKLSIKFEMDGYETAQIDREVRVLSQTISVEMIDSEKAKLAKLDSVPEYTIKTSPEGAKVIVNGEDKGTSPVKLANVKFGEELKVEISMDGYETRNSVLVATKNGDPETTVTLIAAKNGKTTAVAKDTKANTTNSVTNKAKTTPPKTQAKTPAGSGKGTLTVKAIPWATVSIDGSRVGNTPINNRTLTAGSHKVELLLPPKQKKVSKSVTIKSDALTTLTYDFNSDVWK